MVVVYIQSPVLTSLVSAIITFSGIINGVPLRDLEICGRIPRFRSGRIIGGREASFGEVPWVASVQRNHQHFCGASIISSKIILSAAHCFNPHENQEELSVVLGTHRIAEGEEQGIKFQRFGVKRVISHPQFDGGIKYLNDIALVELTEKIEWSDFVTPVCLPSSGEDFLVRSSSSADAKEQIKNAIASGWGRTWGQKEWRSELELEENTQPEILDFEKEFQQHSEILKILNLTILPNSECDEHFSKAWNPMTLASSQLCAGTPEKAWDEDTASGDSGGPLTIFKDGRWTIAGITSFGTPYKGPGIYIRVSSYLDWIGEMMTSNY